MKTVDFPESIAACDLKDGTCRQLIEIMKVSIEGQGYFMTLAQGHLHLKIKSCLSQILLGHFEPNFVCKLSGIGKLKIVYMMMVT